MVIAAQKRKYFSVTPPAAIVDNSAYTTAEIDTLGWDYCTIVVYLGASDVAIAALQVTESDASGSGHAAITGTRLGTDNNTGGSTSTLPSATDDNKFFVFEIDCRGRKRYLDLGATAGDGTAGTFLTALAILERGDIAPNTAAEAGASQIMRV